MKRLVLTLAFFAVAGSGYAQTPWSTCNDHLIAGVFGFTVQGTKLGGLGPVGQQLGVAMTEFDGFGGLVQIDTITIAGVKTSDFTHPQATGTYTVNPDCTGTFTINFTDGRPTIVTNFVVVENGNEIDTVVISAGGKEGIVSVFSIGKRRATAAKVELPE